jgi:hypothetical protein
MRFKRNTPLYLAYLLGSFAAAACLLSGDFRQALTPASIALLAIGLRVELVVAIDREKLAKPRESVEPSRN